MSLSRDALVFGFGFLKNAKSRLSFGGESARNRITDRARAALEELEREGYAVRIDPDTEDPGRESWQGTGKEPSITKIVYETIGFEGIDRWSAFEPIREASPEP